MSKPEPLAADALYKRCDPGLFSFETTAELADVSGIIGQNRAIGAVRFGVDIQRPGYNLYVMGPPGIGKHTLVRQFLEQKAAGRTTPDDWCYVNNFEQGHKPHALRLPPGRGTALKRDMEKLVEELGVVLPATFEGEEYRSRIQALERGVERTPGARLQQPGRGGRQPRCQTVPYALRLCLRADEGRRGARTG